LRSEVVATLADCWNQGHPDGSGPSRHTGPALVLTGADDPFVTADAVSAGVSPRLPRATTAVVDGAGHWPHLEQARAVAARIDGFLERTVAEFPADVREQGWTQAFADKTEAGFAEKFTQDVVLEASALNRPAEGRDLVTVILTTASGIYESLAFTHEATDESRTYLEWEATAFDGLKLSGITVLTKNQDAKITHAAIHHRPLGALHRFSSELRRRLDGTVDSSYFHGD
jgi:hypothetical protein